MIDYNSIALVIITFCAVAGIIASGYAMQATLEDR